MSNYTVALSGLQNTSLAIDTVSNNIANANTVGYKAGEYVFADQFVKAVNPADQARVGMGVQTPGVRRPILQGTITNSANPLDLAISGRGMFRLLQGSGTAGSVDPSAVYYSRNGQFGVDKEGYIVNENGMYLTGYQPTLDGEGITDDIIKNHGLLRMPNSNLPGNETTYSRVSAMLDSTGNAFTSTANVAFDPTQATYNNKTTQTVFDNEGNAHTLEVYYRRISDGQLQITSGSNGYTYSPGPSSSPNTLGDTLVTLNKESVLRVDSPALAGSMSNATVNSSNTFTLSQDPSNAGSAVTLSAGMKIFVNGVDSGATVDNYNTSTNTVTIANAGTISLNNGAAITFYAKDNSPTITSPASGSSGTTLTLSAVTNLVVGDKLYFGAVDSGATITAINTTDGTVTLSKLVTVAANPVFKHSLNMTLVTPDGTEITVQGASNRKSSGEILTTTMAQVEVYASIDGKFYDYQDAATFSNRSLIPQTPGIGGISNGGYRAVSELNFIGGRNLDSLVTDPVSGNPMFNTITKLTTRVTNQAGGSSDLVFDLDLSDTSMHAGAFQITASNQNGEPVARLTNVTVDDAGRIVAVYGSGKQQYVGQIALVHFDNAEGLIPVGKNAFAASSDSGTEHSADGVLVGRAGTGIFGDIKGQALEASNVDLANELVKLMVLQRSYTANSQSMRAYDQTLRDTLQIMS